MVTKLWILDLHFFIAVVFITQVRFISIMAQKIDY